MADNRPPASPLFRAASEPDLAALAAPAPRSPRPVPPLHIPPSRSNSTTPSPPPLPPRRTTTTPSPPPPATPPLSPRAAPSRRPSRRLSNAASPDFARHPNPAVSFTEYVASEFATEPHAPRSPRFAAYHRDVSPPRASLPGFAADLASPPPPRPTASSAALNAHVAAGLPPPNDSMPSLPGEFDQPPLSKPDHPGAPSVPLHPRARWSRLDCIQIDMDGRLTQRTLTRAEILQEARVNVHADQTSTSSLARFFDESAPYSEQDTVQSRRAAQRAFRDYLRNSLQARDIRQVDPAFVAKPALWVRHSALVVSLEGLRAIILYNKMFLFDPTRRETQQLVFVAKRSILANPDAENPQPFEFKALESILIFLSMGLDREFSDLKPKIDSYLHQLPNELTTKMLEELRRKKQQLNHFHARAGNVKTILENLLEEDEEMASMYLTEKHMSRSYVRSSEDHSEIETLLEAYLQVIDEHVNHANLLNDAIDDTEDLVMIHLDTLRNRLLSVELALSVVGMMFSFGGVIAGIFGMNIQIPLFDTGTSRLWFMAVVVIIFFLVVSVSWMVLLSLRRRGLYSLY